MLNKKEARDSNASPPSTKDVLGEHLHHKVSQILDDYFRNSKNLMTDGCSVADKVTGMLLERSDNDIRKMLQIDRFLMDNIEMALTFLYRESLSSSDSSSSSSGTKLSHEEIGEILFSKVQKLEKDLAPEITGMLLELDVRTLLQLLSSDDQIFIAINKAKTTLASTQPPTCSGSLGFLMKMPLFSLLPSKNYAAVRSDGVMSQSEREHIGLDVFSEALTLYQDADCASRITGMILEMDKSALQELRTNNQDMKAAILKAYSALEASL